MSEFLCTYRDGKGKRRKARHSGDNIESIRSRLLEQNCYPLTIVAVRDSDSRAVRLSLRETSRFAESLGMLLEGGHSLKEAMPLLESFKPGSPTAVASRHLATGFEKGHNFRRSLEQAPVRFPSGFAGMCAVGEKTGSLSGVMVHLGNHYDRLASLREKAFVAMIYPLLVLAVALVAGVFLATVTLPNLQAVMSAVEPETVEAGPTATDPIIRLLYIAAIVVALASVLYGVLQSRRNPERKGILLRLPLLKNVVINWNLMGWAFALEILASRGQSLDKALEEAAHAVSHHHIRAIMKRAADSVRRGDRFSDYIDSQELLPTVLSGWVRIGEISGQTESVFQSVRKHFERQVNRSIDIATQMVEPVLILFVGGLMVLLVGRYLVPLFRTIGTML